MAKGHDSAGAPTGAEAPTETPERWSAVRKTDVVLRLLQGDPAHAGTITTARSNVMWGTDATRFYAERDGWCWWFGAIDHASDDTSSAPVAGFVRVRQCAAGRAADAHVIQPSTRRAQARHDVAQALAKT
jgi:hypothetical protein